MTSAQHYWLIGEPATARWAVVVATRQSEEDPGETRRIFVITCSTSSTGCGAHAAPAATQLLRLVARQDPKIVCSYGDVLRLLAPDLLTSPRDDALAHPSAALTAGDILRLTLDLPRLLGAWGRGSGATIAFLDAERATRVDQRVIEALTNMPADVLRLMVCTTTEENLSVGLRRTLAEKTTCCDLRPQKATPDSDVDEAALVAPWRALPCSAVMQAGTGRTDSRIRRNAVREAGAAVPGQPG